jgi:PEP-CTERM motif
MTPTIVKILHKRITRRALCVCRKAMALAGIFVLMFQTATAGPVLVKDVFQRVNSLQGLADLQLRDVSQQQGAGSKTAKVDSSSQTGITTEALLSTVNGETPKIGVEVEDAIVEGTVCDCGEILLPAAGFPKWPLLFLAGIPLIFLGHDDCESCKPTTCLTCETVTFSNPTPTPIPSPSIDLRSVEPIPEPTSLLLFGTGLLAVAGGMRRKYARKNSGDSDERDENGQ